VAQSGVHVLLATGRSPWAGLADLAAELGLHGPQVATQGAVVADPLTGRLEQAVPLPPSLYAEVLAFADALDLDPVVGFTDGLAMRHEDAIDFPGELSPLATIRTTDDLAALAAERPLRVFLNTPEASHRHVLAAASVWFTGKASLIWSDSHGVEVLAAGVTKWTGVSFIADRLRIPHAAVAAVGDAPNDIGMLHAAGCSAAMGSAPTHVRNLADVVVLSSDQDGIIDALAWFFPDLAAELERPIVGLMGAGLPGTEAIALP
jgi:Cof subfamily protein (haloacid dehalogenase superfamily)